MVPLIKCRDALDEEDNSEQSKSVLNVSMSPSSCLSRPCSHPRPEQTSNESML